MHRWHWPAFSYDAPVLLDAHRTTHNFVQHPRVLNEQRKNAIGLFVHKSIVLTASRPHEL